MNQAVIIEEKDNVLSITLNRPEVLNAINQEMLEGLFEAIIKAKNNKDIRVVLISGAGRSFCPGSDIGKMGDRTPVSRFDYLGLMNEIIIMITELEKPVISAVNGYAAGLGASLALAADQIVAAEDAKFVISFSKVGLVSDGGALFFLAQNLGAYRAKELYFNAQPIDALKAREWGIVNQIYSTELLQEEAMNYARKLAKGPTRAYGLIKKHVNRALVSDLATTMELERSLQSIIGTTEDHQEGVRAFLEKRLPNFRGN